MFGLSRIELILIAAFALVVATGGAIAYFEHKGAAAERNAAAARTLEETEKGRKARETNDEDARTMDDKKALECLRRPAGC